MSFLAVLRPITDELCQVSAVGDHRGRAVSDDNHPERLSFLGRPLPPAFEIRVVTVAPGCSKMYHEAEWRDALVVVERGKIQLEGFRGGHRDFATGDVLCLIGLSLRALHNRGLGAAVLVAVSRRRPVTPGGCSG